MIRLFQITIGAVEKIAHGNVMESDREWRMVQKGMSKQVAFETRLEG